jgi:DNA segregation ATPase FtsK/SpoIIIE, S-DNA-T family
MARKPDIDLWEVLYRKRLGLGPFYVGAGAAALAGVCGLLTQWQTYIAVGVLVLALAAWALRLRDSFRRYYALTVVISCCLWIIFARMYTPVLLSWVIVVDICGCLLLGIPWWGSHRKRSQVTMEETLRDFPTLMGRIGYDKIVPPHVKMSPIGYGGRLTWAPGVYDVDDVLGHKKQFENAFGAKFGQMRMERDGDSTNSVLFQVVTKDPHKDAIPWTPPTELRAATDPLVVGPREDGVTVTLERYDRKQGTRHMLLAGTTGSGKSGGVNLAVADDVLSDEIFTIGLDMKRVELAPWAPALGIFQPEREKAAALIRAMAQPGGLLDERKIILAEHGDRVWDPRKHGGPIISITMDEIKELLGNGDAKTVAAFTLIANESRALGIRFLLATQYPTLEALGSSQIRQQIRHKICCRMEDSDGEGFVFGGGVRVRAEAISEDRPGTCYIKDGTRVIMRPVRMYWISDEMVAAIVAARAGHTPELDERSRRAIERFLPEFRDWGPGTAGTSAGTEPEPEHDSGTGDAGTGTEDAGTDPAAEQDGEDPMEYIDLQSGPELDVEDVLAARRASMTPEQLTELERSRRAALAAVPGQRLSPEQARDALLRTLAEAWPEAVEAKALYEAADRSSSWFYGIAQQMAEEGVVKRTDHGMWALIAAPPQLVRS